MEVREAKNKRALLSELLDQGMVLVTLDARRDGVDVPRHLRDDAQLRLNLSYRFGLPLVLDEEGVTATLTFAGSPYACRLPWESLYLFVPHASGRPMLFPGDVPSEISVGSMLPDAPAPTARAHAAPSTAPATARAGRRAQQPPRLRVVPVAGATATPQPPKAPGAAARPPRGPAPEPVEEAPPSETPRRPPRRGHLRIVK